MPLRAPAIRMPEMRISRTTTTSSTHRWEQDRRGSSSRRPLVIIHRDHEQLVSSGFEKLAKLCDGAFLRRNTRLPIGERGQNEMMPAASVFRDIESRFPCRGAGMIMTGASATRSPSLSSRGSATFPATAASARLLKPLDSSDKVKPLVPCDLRPRGIAALRFAPQTAPVSQNAAASR